MNRREFSQSLAAAAAAPNAAANNMKPATFELRYIYLRNGSQVQKASDFLGNSVLPAIRRAGAGPAGFFAPVIAEQAPFVLSVVSYASFGAWEEVQEKLAADRDFRKGYEDFHSMTELTFMRSENALLRAFSSIPAMEVPAVEDGRAPRIFELRTYEAPNVVASKRKIRMFDEGEIAIFRKTGLQPVFFGETLVGRNLPNLTYLLAFDDLAARERNWKAFVSHPEWLKLRATPGLSDAEIVSNISNSILRPLPFSPIR